MNKISSYFKENKFKVNTVDPSFNQMMEIIDQK